MGTSGCKCTLITASAVLTSLTAATLTVRRKCYVVVVTVSRWLYHTWHALHQGKAKQTILEWHEYSTIKCMVCC